MSRVVVLGGGPAGLAAALELAESGVDVTLLERQRRVGGNAASFEVSGVRVDFGSHRLHPASDAAVLERIRGLLGDDLLVRPRHGRIRLLGRWIHFPLRPLDLALRVHPRFAFGVGVDLLKGLAPGGGANDDAGETFASVLERGLGRTICEEFYFPYARKLWGVEPRELSPIQAYKRVSAGSIGKMLKRLLPGAGGGSGGANTKGVFYYPRRGYGQISEALADAAKAAGADVRLGCDVRAVRLAGGGAEVEVVEDGAVRTLAADQVFSTIPITVLARLLDPTAPPAVLEAAGGLDFRDMLLIYGTLERDRFTEFDAHYFPGEEFPFSRVSEPKNYAALAEPRGRTVLCAELPCSRDDAIWSQGDDALGRVVTDGLARAGLPIGDGFSEVHVERVPFVYPLYRSGYERHFEAIDAWLAEQQGVLSFGRQGLYVHDNTHHAIYMAQAAARCLGADGTIDRAAWERERRVFETHVVED